MFSGPDCGPGKCECGVRTETYYRCVSFVGEDGERCGRMFGPFPGRWEYMAQGKGHFTRFDDDDVLRVVDGTDHEHGGTNYCVPVTGNG